MPSFPEEIFTDVDWRYPTILDSVDDAAQHLVTYLGGGSRHWYTGAFFNHVAKNADPNRITADDLIAIRLLSVRYSSDLYLSLLGVPHQASAERPTGWPGYLDVKDYPHSTARITELFEAVPTDATIDDPDAREYLTRYGNELWSELRRQDFGQVGVSKLMAVKRPGLFPIYDSFIERTLKAKGTVKFYEKMHSVMNASGGWLPTRLDEIRETARVSIDESPSPRNPMAAALLQELSVLRTLDIVLWMDGQNP